jgi:molybdate transport system permease protein
MDWQALILSLKLAGATALILIPLGMLAARALAWHDFAGRRLLEAALALPLVLPPTVLGFYLLSVMGGGTPLGDAFRAVAGRSLAFSFEGLLLASIIFNIPFALQPMQRAFESIAPDLRAAAACCGLSRWRTLLRIEIPLAWPGIVSALTLTFAHTLGEFGVVLMVGGNIPGETRTVALSIYDRVQAFDTRAAGVMAATLLAISVIAIAVGFATTARPPRRHA